MLVSWERWEGTFQGATGAVPTSPGARCRDAGCVDQGARAPCLSGTDPPMALLTSSVIRNT